MSMYVQLLSSSLDGRLDELTGEALLRYTLACRADMLNSESRQATSAYSALAVEVAYDRALLKLCEAHDIEVAAAQFSHPEEQRHRLELELADAGIDLTAS